MKTLILSCDMGGGHNSAAKALAQWGGRNGIECETADTLSFISTDFSRTMSDLYIFTTKSNLIKVIYKTGEIVPARAESSPPFTWQIRSTASVSATTSLQAASPPSSVLTSSRPRP